MNQKSKIWKNPLINQKSMNQKSKIWNTNLEPDLGGGGTSAVKTSSNSDQIETSNRRGSEECREKKGLEGVGGGWGTDWSGGTRRGWEQRHVQGRGTGGSEERGDG